MGCLVKISSRVYRRTRKSALNFGGRTDLDTVSPDSRSGPDQPWQRAGSLRMLSMF